MIENQGGGMDPDEALSLRTYWRSIAFLVLLAKLDRPAGVTEIAYLLNIDQATARKHLRYLTEGGLVIRRSSHNGYSLNRAGRQAVQSETANISRNSARSSRNFVKTSRFGGSTTSSALNSRKIENREAVEEEEAENARSSRISAKFSRKYAQTSRFHDNLPLNCTWIKRNKLSGARAAELISALEAANLAALRAEGLGSNHRVQRVCRLPHVTPEYIAGQARRLRQEHRFAATLLLHIVESGDPLPSEQDPSQQEAEDRRRYFTGTYADIVEH
jgi:predicted transcriptional regulator